MKSPFLFTTYTKGWLCVHLLNVALLHEARLPQATCDKPPVSHALPAEGAEALTVACLWQAAHQASRRPRGQPSTCSALACRLSCGKPESEGINSLWGGRAAGKGRRLGSWRKLHHRHPATSAADEASSETGRFPVVSAPLPSATLYCKQRATLTKAPWCPVSGWEGGGRLLPCSRGKPSLDGISSLSPGLKGSAWKKRNIQAFLHDLRRASSEWQLRLLHAVWEG